MLELAPELKIKCVYFIFSEAITFQNAACSSQNCQVLPLRDREKLDGLLQFKKCCVVAQFFLPLFREFVKMVETRCDAFSFPLSKQRMVAGESGFSACFHSSVAERTINLCLPRMCPFQTISNRDRCSIVLLSHVTFLIAQ